MTRRLHSVNEARSCYGGSAFFLQMKEFGVYIIKKTFEKEFVSVSNKLTELKIPHRPFVCVRLSGQCWLIALSSLNPKDVNYSRKLHKQIDYNYADSQNPPKAMDIFGDILQTGISNFKSVAQYYNAIPIKHKYCNKYRDKFGKHIEVDERIGKKMKGQLINYLQFAKRKKLTGFIGKYVSEGHMPYRLYPIDCFAIRSALYQKHFKLLKDAAQKRLVKKEYESAKAQKSELKKSIKQPSHADQVLWVLENCGERIAEDIAAIKSRQAQQVEQYRQVQQVRQGGQGKSAASRKVRSK